MRAVYLALCAWTFLAVLWAVFQGAAPIGQVDAFYGRHKLEIQDVVGDPQSVQLMASIAATFAQQTRMTVIYVSVPLTIAALGWFVMFTTYVPPNQ